MFKHIQWKKAVPLLIIGLLASLVAGTDVLSAAVQTQIVDVFKTYVSGIVPYTANIFVGLIFICLANLLYDPMKAGLEKALNLSNADERGRRIVSRAVLLIYWLIAIVVGVSFIAPDFLSKLVVGFGLFGAAIALALQGIANDFIAGVLLNFRPKFCVGDEIELIGVAVKGKVTDIGYVLTVLDTESGTFTVPNREVWSKPVKVTKPGAGKTTTTGGLSCATDGTSKSTTDGGAVTGAPVAGGAATTITTPGGTTPTVAGDAAVNQPTGDGPDSPPAK